MTEYTARVTVFADTDAEAIARVTDALSGHNLAFASIKPATSANLTSDEYSTLPVRVKVRDSTVAAFGTWEEAAEYAQNLVIGADDNSAEDVSISFSLVTV